LLEAAYSKGTLYVLTIPDNFGDLYRLPPETLTRIKEVVAKDLFVRVEAPAQVSLFAYDNNSFIVESFLPHAEQARLVLDKRLAAIRDLTTGQRFTGQAEGDHMVYRTFLQPHTYRVFVAEAAQ
jgi:predicted  nucleic acid-binding Zn ribbon protein